ncbi:MAG: hypothetical protein P8M78_16185 [Myxococcota bacterium]|nr:hypothetical protein [Myxococcota bacterium]
MSLRTCLWTLACGISIAAAGTASALTVVNDSAEALNLSSPVSGATSRIEPGAQFGVPSSWGDDRHIYLTASSTTGLDVCGALQDRYGTLKIPVHWVGIGVGGGGDCAPLAQLPATPTPPPVEPVPPTPDEPDSPDGGNDSDDSGDGVTNPPNASDRDFPPRGNGTWVYDATFPQGPDGEPYVSPGLWREAISEYNAQAEAGHRLDQVFSYGGDLEMECRGGSDCTPNKMHVYYYPPTAQSANRSFQETGASGFVSTQAYAKTPGEVVVIPTFDGRFDAGGYLQEFETLSESQARTYADIFARAVCADPAVPGVQLDLEPFDINDPAQFWFYDQVALNLAGENQDLEPILGCRSEDYPQGRFFSVFTFANQITPELGEVFTRYGNGYVIISLYDLGPGAATVASDPDEYRGYVANEIARTVSNSAAASDVPFQLAIPAAASTKEFERYRGTPSGYAQRQYVEQALEAMEASGVRANPQFLGTAVWGWSRFMAWPPHTNNVFEPGSPQAEVLSVLGDRL